MHHITVWGEHAGLIQELTRIRTRLNSDPALGFFNRFRGAAKKLAAKDTDDLVTGEGVTAEWANLFTPQDLDSALREFMIRLFTTGLPDDRRWGFKEIQYGDEEIGTLHALFPQAKFIFQTRDPEAVLASQFTHFAKGNPERLVGRLRQISNYFAMLDRMLQNPGIDAYSHVVRYEELATHGFQAAEALAVFLGDTFDRDGATRISKERSHPITEQDPQTTAARIASFMRQHGVEPPQRLCQELQAAYVDILDRIKVK